MLILGSGGFAMQVLDVLSEDPNLDFSKLSFYNDTGRISNVYLHEQFNLVSDYVQYVEQHATVPFILGTGTPAYRKRFFELFSNLNKAIPIQVISKHAVISPIHVRIGTAAAILAGAVIMGNVQIGTGSLINCNSSIGHDSILGDFVEICPGVTIGENCIIGAGSIVTKDVPSHHKVIGNPGIAVQI